MPYVQRSDGAITGEFANAQPGYAEEWLDDDAPEIVARRLLEQKADAVMALRAAVSRARLRYAPDAAHQTTIYDVKAQEADAYVEAGRPPDASAFPILMASASANHRGVSEHADVIRAKRDAWVAIAAETERLREAGENAVRAAATLEQLEAIKLDYDRLLAAI